MKEIQIKWNCASHFHSYNHILDEDIFKEWNEKIGKQLDMSTFFHFQSKQDFIFHFHMPSSIALEEADKKAYMISRAMLVALNIANPGSLFWEHPKLMSYDLKIEHVNPKIKIEPVPVLFPDRKISLQDFTRDGFFRSELIFRVLVPLQSRFFFNYIKGLNLLTFSTADFNYYEEVFLNFWKTLENFIATEIKKDNKRPTFEDIKDCLREAFGEKFWTQEHIAEFSRMHNQVRGRSAAHSYGKEITVTYDDVIKLKSYVDAYIYLELKKRADIEWKKMLPTTKDPIL